MNRLLSMKMIFDIIYINLLGTCLYYLGAQFVPVPASDFGYTGQVVVQDLVCDGTEVVALSCQANYNIEASCMGSSNAAVVQCFRNCKYMLYFNWETDGSLEE